MRNLIEKDEALVELWVSRFKYIEKIEKEIMKCGKSELGEWMIRQAFVNEMSNMDIQSVTDIKPVEILTEEDYRELHDRFGDYVEFVIRDMITGKGERWKERGETMTIQGAINQLIQMKENSTMPDYFKPYFEKVIKTVSEYVEKTENSKTYIESENNV